MRAIVRKERQRGREGKRSLFYVRGRWIDPKKVEKFAMQNAIELDRQGWKEPISESHCHICAHLVLNYR